MGDMLRESNPDLASKTGVDDVEPVKPEPSPDPADHKPEEEAAAPDAGGEKKPDAAPDANAPTEQELIAEQERQKTEADQKKKDEDAAAQKAKDEAEAAKKNAEAAKPDDPREKRDSDLNVQLSPHTHPKTRQIITSFKENARKARDERDAIQRERDELKRQLDETAAKAKGVALPKETEEELKTLRERVRELDISRDPAIEAKYDKPIAANNKSVIDLLRGFGADHVKDPNNPDKTVVDPRFEANLTRAGLTLKTLQPFIEKLDKAGFVDEAEQLREAVRENTRLTRAKQQEIDSWKGDYETRIKTRTAQSQQQAEQEQKAIQEATDATLKTELAELSKTLPFLNAPPAPQPSDSEPVRKAKQAALDEYNAAAQQVADAMKAFGNAKTPEEARAANAKFSATAILGLVLRQHALPRLQKDLSARDARIKDLEAQLTKLKGAATISRQHAVVTSAPAGGGNMPEIPAGAAITDAMAAFAKGAGVNVNS